MVFITLPSKLAPGQIATVWPNSFSKSCYYQIAQRVMGVFFAPFEQETGADAVNRRIAENLRKAGIAVVHLRHTSLFGSRVAPTFRETPNDVSLVVEELQTSSPLIFADGR